MAESTNDIFRRNHCKTPEWIANLIFFFFKIFAAHCFHEIFRVPIFSIQILFKGSFQSCNKSLINQACSGPYWENIGPRSFFYRPRCTRSVLLRPQADILPVRPSRLVNKIYVSFCNTYTCTCRCDKICRNKLSSKTIVLIFLADNVNNIL